VFDSVVLRWDRPHVDLFATSLNHKLETFVSPVPDPLAFAVDAMSLLGRNVRLRLSSILLSSSSASQDQAEYVRLPDECATEEKEEFPCKEESMTVSSSLVL
jgi:hypothetical protein